MATSVLVGRLLALMCHPALAWRRLGPAGRAALTAGYAGVSYVTVLLTLFALRR